MRANRSAFRLNGRGRRRLRSCGHGATARHGDCWGRVRRAVHAARGSKPGLEVEVVEAGDGVGGTWYWNRYPGPVRHPSMEYSYGWHEALQQEWEWSEKYATQPRFWRTSIMSPTLRSSSRHHVRDAGRGVFFDEATERWTVRSSDGEERIARLWSWRPVAVIGEPPGHPGPRRFRRSDIPHGPMAARGSRLHRSAAAVIGTEVRSAVDPVDRRAG